MITIQLEHNGKAFNVTDVDPSGLEDLKHILKRGTKNYGLLHSITTELRFYKEAKAFIQAVYESKGPEAEIIVTLMVYVPSDYEHFRFYSGRLDLMEYEWDEISVQAPIIEISEQVKFNNLKKQKVNLFSKESQAGVQLPEQSPTVVKFHSRKIKKEFNSVNRDSVYEQEAAINLDLGTCSVGPCEKTTGYLSILSIDFGDVIINDMPGAVGTGAFVQPLRRVGQYSSNLDKGDLIMHTNGVLYTMVESSNDGPGASDTWSENMQDFLSIVDGGRQVLYNAEDFGDCFVSINLNQKITITASQVSGPDVDVILPCSNPGTLGKTRLEYYLEHRGADGIIKSLELIGEDFSVNGCGQDEREGDYTQLNYNGTIKTEPGDKISVFGLLMVYARYELKGGAVAPISLQHKVKTEIAEEGNGVNLINETTFAETDHNCIFIHEALQRCAEVITDYPGGFYSEFFGREELGYIEDGPGAYIALTSGGELRKISGFGIYASWDEMIESLKTVFNVDYGFELKNDRWIIRVEKAEYFFPRDKPKIQVSKAITPIRKKVISEEYFQSVEFSYPKLEAGEQNAIDEFNTTRHYRTGLTQTEKPLILNSSIRASGYEIESQRRLIDQTKDSRLDNDLFFICLVSDGAIRTETGENYNIQGLYSPETAYNVRISPARCIKNHLNRIAIGLFKSSVKKIVLSYSEYNSTMTTQGPNDNQEVNEGAGYNLEGITPLFYPESYRWSSKMSQKEAALLFAKPKSAILLPVGDQKISGWIKLLDYSPKSGTGELTLYREI